ncbi:hypothetical protein CBS101457_003485 [Exobasidium rhododendri]|nr:hypothetical protein CBS101457_003485 [Exobasidium rhododendri]
MAGHRLLLVHLFLPDTLAFQDWPQESQNTHYRIPSQQAGSQLQIPTTIVDAPPSPPSNEATANVLSVHELEQRLARAALLKTKTAIEDDDDGALSDSESPICISEVAPRSRSARTSFTEQSKKVNMSLLMSEAAHGSISGAGSGAHVGLIKSPTTMSGKSVRGSPSGGNRATTLPDVSRAGLDQLPVAGASDHGRSATSSLSPSQAFATLSSQTSPNSNSSAFEAKSRHGSSSGGSANRTFHNSMSLSMTSTQSPKDNQDDGSGTRAPGAKVSGKAGTMTPISIIGDLAAKQSSIQPRQVSTAGDSERHHPFGSGAVTPMRGSQTPGPARTPGNVQNPFLQQVRSKTPMSQNQAKLTDVQEKGGNESMRPPAAGVRRPLGRILSNQELWTTNNNGREAPIESPIPAAVKTNNLTGGGLDDEDEKRYDPRANSTVSASENVNSSVTTTSRSPITNTTTSSNSNSFDTNGVHPPPSGSGRIRTISKRNQSRNGMGRRPSIMGGPRAPYRREASTDILLDDTLSEEENTPPHSLPPFEFASNPSSNGGLVNAVASLTRDRLRSGKVFIGTPGISMESLTGDKEQAHIADRFRKEKESLPVWVDDATFEGAYNHFCKQILWPTFHYTIATQKGLDNEQESFRCYKRLNEKFASAIVKEYKEGDIIWINDYHLLLVPQMVRERLPHATIGFFLHIAFPSSEIFRCLSIRNEILRGMLGADLIGFQTLNFCRHFRQTVSRILQLEATPKGIQIDGRGGFVTVAPFPIGIDVRSLNRKRAEPDVSEWVDKLRTRYAGKKVVVGRDKLDSIKGVRQKLLAFEIFLDEHSDWVGKIVLIQIALATTEDNEEIGAATEVIARINNKYSTLTYQPVVFLHVQDITFSQYLALLTMADAFMASSLREGMNLTSHEYVVCQEESHRPLILSEFTGTYSALRACIGINPWNTKQMSNAIFKAITMSDEEAFERWKDLHRQVVTQTAQHWIQNLLGRLERAHLNQERRNNCFIPRLEMGQLVSEWRASKSRLLLFDLEDTLSEEESITTVERVFEPSEAVIEVLQDLCSDARNRVYLLSGRGADDLEKFVARVARLGLVAENGCAVMHAGEPREEGVGGGGGGGGVGKGWTSLVAGTNMSWRGPVKEILSYFTERTPGSWMEDRGASILWRFWSNKEVRKDGTNKREFAWSRRQAAEVQNLIYDSLGERFSLRIIPGETSFLIMPKNTSRAGAIQHIISLSHIGMIGGQNNSSLTSSAGIATEGQRPHYTPINRDQMEKVKMDSSTFKQPSNDWQSSQQQLQQQKQQKHQMANSWSTNMMMMDCDDYSFESRALSATNPYSLHPNGMGSFDFVLCIGQDDMLLSYINSLDLPFAPITCTSSYLEDKSRSGGHNNGGSTFHGNHGGSSEANYYLNGVKDVISSIEEIVAFKGRDQRWGLPATLEV